MSQAWGLPRGLETLASRFVLCLELEPLVGTFHPQSPKPPGCDLNLQRQLCGSQDSVPVGGGAAGQQPGDRCGPAFSPIFSFLSNCHIIVLYWIRHTFFNEKALNFALHFLQEEDFHPEAGRGTGRQGLWPFYRPVKPKGRVYKGTELGTTCHGKQAPPEPEPALPPAGSALGAQPPPRPRTSQLPSQSLQVHPKEAGKVPSLFLLLPFP